MEEAPVIEIFSNLTKIFYITEILANITEILTNITEILTNITEILANITERHQVYRSFP